MAPGFSNTLIEVLRSTLAQIEQEELSGDALRELKRSIVLTISELELWRGGDEKPSPMTSAHPAGRVLNGC